MLWQLWCHCNPDHDKFSFTVVAIFPNVCLWRRSLCSNLVLTLKNCIEPPSYASTGYVVAIWSSFLFGSFVKICGTCDNFLGKWSTAPPLAKNFPYAYAHATAFRVRISFTTLRDEPWTIFWFYCGGKTNLTSFLKLTTKRMNSVSASLPADVIRDSSRMYQHVFLIFIYTVL